MLYFFEEIAVLYNFANQSFSTSEEISSDSPLLNSITSVIDKMPQFERNQQMPIIEHYAPENLFQHLLNLRIVNHFYRTASLLVDLSNEQRQFIKIFELNKSDSELLNRHTNIRSFYTEYLEKFKAHI